MNYLTLNNLVYFNGERVFHLTGFIPFEFLRGVGHLLIFLNKIDQEKEDQENLGNVLGTAKRVFNKMHNMMMERDNDN